jgi:2-aminoadipate transaminase
MQYHHLLAKRTERMAASAIREILKVVSQPGMISLAGGIPAPQSFPMDSIEKLTAVVLEKYGPQAFQYDLTEGFLPLRTALTDHLAQKGIKATNEEIIISSGSQGALDAIGKILISQGDKVAVESPTYLGALQAFNPYEPTYIAMETDEQGLIPESLEEVLKQHQIKFIYLVPTFQNPTGRTLNLKRREQIAEILKRHDALLFEDDPYADLRYQGEALPTLQSLAPEHVVYAGTLSKVFAPGLRVGYLVAPKPIRDWLVLGKQGVDLQSSTFTQALAAEYLSGGYLQERLPRIIDLYRPRQQAMLNAMEEHFPDTFKWSRPQGGMFIWAEGPQGYDLESAYHKAIARNVAFVPGRYFYAQPNTGLETLRLNFTMADEPVLEQAIATLGQVLREEQR